MVWCRFQGLRSVVTVVVVLLATVAYASCVCSGLGCSLCMTSDGGGADQASSDEIPSHLRAFNLQGGQQPQPGGDGTPITITYSYNNFLDGGLKDPMGISVPADFIRTVTEEAFGLWAEVAPLNFVEVPDIGTTVFTSNSASYNVLDTCESPSDVGCDFGTIRLSHRFINGTDAQNGMPTTKALAYFPSSGGNIAGDIQFDNGDPWAIVGTSSEPDILGIMTHEIGHTLGLGHTNIDGAVMFPAALRRMGPGTGLLTQDDINGVRAIYGTGVGSVTPLTVVPEPGAAMLALCGAVGVVCGGRRRRAD